MDDPVRLARPHAVRAAAALDLVDELHAFYHLSPDRVLPVQRRTRGEHDEELAVAAVWIRGAGHAAGAAQEVPLAGLQRHIGQLAAAAPGAGRIAALRHEALDHPV